MANLYQSSQRLKNIEELSQLMAEEDIEADDIEDYLVAVEHDETLFLEALEVELDRKARLESLAAAAEFEFKRAMKRLHGLTNQIETSKEGIKKALITTGRTKLELPSGQKLRIGQSAGGVDIYDERDFIDWAVFEGTRSELLNEKTVVSPNKVGIKKALKEGMKIPGVAIAEPTTYLKIS